MHASASPCLAPPSRLTLSSVKPFDIDTQWQYDPYLRWEAISKPDLTFLPISLSSSTTKTCFRDLPPKTCSRDLPTDFKLGSKRTTLLQNDNRRCMYVLEACVNVLSTKLELKIEDAGKFDSAVLWRRITKGESLQTTLRVSRWLVTFTKRT